MKKIFVFGSIFLTLAIIVGTAYVVNAQANNPPVETHECPGWDAENSGYFPHNMQRLGQFSEDGNCLGYSVNGENGPMHQAMTETLAGLIGLSIEEIEERISNGEHHFEIAQSEGFTQEEIVELMQQIHKSYWENYDEEDYFSMPHGRRGQFWNDSEEWSQQYIDSGCHRTRISP